MTGSMPKRGRAGPRRARLPVRAPTAATPARRQLQDIKRNEDPRLSFSTPEFKEAQRAFTDAFKVRGGRTRCCGLLRGAQHAVCALLLAAGGLRAWPEEHRCVAAAVGSLAARRPSV
jgi:hypothetical protein